MHTSDKVALKKLANTPCCTGHAPSVPSPRTYNQSVWKWKVWGGMTFWTVGGGETFTWFPHWPTVCEAVEWHSKFNDRIHSLPWTTIDCVMRILWGFQPRAKKTHMRAQPKRLIMWRQSDLKINLLQICKRPLPFSRLDDFSSWKSSLCVQSWIGCLTLRSCVLGTYCCTQSKQF